MTDDDDYEAYVDLLWRDAVPFSLRATDMTHNAGKQTRAIIIISTYYVFHVKSGTHRDYECPPHTRVGTLIVATIYLQLIQNRYMFRSFTVLQCSHQHCVQPVVSDVEVTRA